MMTNSANDTDDDEMSPDKATNMNTHQSSNDNEDVSASQMANRGPRQQREMFGNQTNNKSESDEFDQQTVGNRSECGRPIGDPSFCNSNLEQSLGGGQQKEPLGTGTEQQQPPSQSPSQAVATPSLPPALEPPSPSAVAAATLIPPEEEDEYEELDKNEVQVDHCTMRGRTRKLFCFISKKVALGAVAMASVNRANNSKWLSTEFFEMYLADIQKECDGFYFGRTAEQARKDWNGVKRKAYTVSWAVAMTGNYHNGQEVRRQEEIDDYQQQMKQYALKRSAEKARKSTLDRENAAIGLLLKKQRLAKSHGGFHKDVIQYLSSTFALSRSIDGDNGYDGGTDTDVELINNNNTTWSPPVEFRQSEGRLPPRRRLSVVVPPAANKNNNHDEEDATGNSAAYNQPSTSSSSSSIFQRVPVLNYFFGSSSSQNVPSSSHGTHSRNTSNLSSTNFSSYGAWEDDRGVPSKNKQWHNYRWGPK